MSEVDVTSSGMISKWSSKNVRIVLSLTFLVVLSFTCFPFDLLGLLEISDLVGVVSISTL